MIQKEKYLKPEVDVTHFVVEEALLTASVTTGASTGEGITWDSEFNPW